MRVAHRSWRILFVLLAGLAAAIVGAQFDAAPAAGQAGTVVFEGRVDRTTNSAPVWVNTTFVPTVTGEHTLQLDWPGDADLGIHLRRSVDNKWIDSAKGRPSPHVLTGELVAGVEYEIAVWARARWSDFTVTAFAPDAGDDVLLQGPLDRDRIDGPRWKSTIINSGPGGELTLEATWSGSARVGVAVRRAVDDQWVASAVRDTSPNTLTATLAPNVDYKVEMWVASGSSPNVVLTRVGITEPPPAQRPNVVIINLDDARVDTMEVMTRTKRWFADEGTTFSNAFVTTPSCCPSRATLMTGQYVHNNGQVVQNQRFTNEADSIQRNLRRSGYFTGHSGKYFQYYRLTQRGQYWDHFAHTTGGHFDQPMFVDGEFVPTTAYSTISIFDYATQQLEDFEQRNDRKPFYLHIAPTAPHLPFDVEPKYEDAPVPEWNPPPSVGEADRSDKPVWVRYQDFSPEVAAEQRTKQLRMMLSVDEQVDLFMQRLDELGELENTLVIFTSDNGYLWAEHGRRGKFVPYTDSVQVPFLVRWPGEVSAGVVSNDYVSHVDILATVLAAAGVEPEHTTDGRNILDPNFSRQHIFTEYFFDEGNNNFLPDWASLRTEDWVYTEWYDEDGNRAFREYYDLVNDPHELDNLFGDATTANDPQVGQIRQQLQAARNCVGVSCP